MNDDQLLRYSRHILLPQVDIAGQQAINASKVLIIGMGGLGSPSAIYLAASGIGHLVLVDDDKVDESNLQRQIIHTETRLGRLKVESARQHLQEINSATQVSILAKRLCDNELLEQVSEADVILDCSDNFITRRQINRICYQSKKPLVSGAAVRLEGQLTVLDFRNTQNPCYECLYPADIEDDTSCARNGVLSPVVGVIGCSQALEAIKLIAGFGQPMVGELGLFDGAANRWRYICYPKNPHCSCCATEI